MIAELMNRDVILQQLEDVQKDLELEIEEGRRTGQSLQDEEALLVELGDAERRERTLSSGQVGFEPPVTERRGQGPAPLDDFAFFSRDRSILRAPRIEVTPFSARIPVTRRCPSRGPKGLLTPFAALGENAQANRWLGGTSGGKE